MLPFLHWLSNRAGITAHNTVTVADLGGGGALGASAPPAESMVKIS